MIIKYFSHKRVFTHDYMDSFQKFEEKTFPNKESLNSNDYHRANTFNIKNLGEYHDLYLKTDVLLLADVFESFSYNMYFLI